MLGLRYKDQSSEVGAISVPMPAHWFHWDPETARGEPWFPDKGYSRTSLNPKFKRWPPICPSAISVILCTPHICVKSSPAENNWNHFHFLHFIFWIKYLKCKVAGLLIQGQWIPYWVTWLSMEEETILLMHSRSLVILGLQWKQNKSSYWNYYLRLPGMKYLLKPRLWWTVWFL